MMVSPVSLECKKICMFRCLYAVGLSVGMQYMLLTVFLLLVNFSILHPIIWITDTFRLMFSFYTWLSIMPLISSVIIFGILQGKLFLSAQKYYATRFAWIWGTAVRKAALFGIHLTVGFLTAWLYSRFLHNDYKNLVLRLQDREFINSRYVFLIFVGVSSGLYFFVKKNLRQDPEIEFPIIQEMKFVKIRSLLYSALYQSLLKSFGSTIIIALSYWILGGIVNRRIAKIFTAETDEQLNTLFAVMTNFRMLLYGWLLCSQILCNMQLMTQFFSIFLGEELRFTIEKDPLMAAAGSEVSLVEALALSKVPVIQKLASLDLYSLSVAKAADRRQEIFALSVPGGHPYNWNQLSAQWLAIINEFTEELSSSVKRISTVKSSPLCAVMQPCSNETVEKILLRQYNETYGIRRMMPDPVESPRPECNPTESIDPCQRVNAVFDRLQKSIEDILKSAFYAIPGLFYLFGELDGARTAFLLSNSQGIVWLIEGLAGICASSLNEDKYGVVQNELSKIMSALLKLKLELDKLNNVNINGKKFDRNLITLKNAVKRSLYRVCTVFGDYLRDLVEDQNDLRHFQCFVSYQET